jgi:hypothetical protein
MALAVAAACAVAGAPRAAGAAPAASPAVKRFALVVGDNTPPHEGLATLRYADDDAVRWTLLLRTFGADVELLTELDAESQRLYGSAAPARRAPNPSELDAAMARLGGAVKAARAAGARTVFFFVYAGHGDVEAGEGYVALGQTRFFRRDLESRVLGHSPADTNHVIIDACRSLYLATDRGPGGVRRPWPQPYFDAGATARFPNTGFLLASSSGGASHEWEEFQAGIFSHEVRSGLLGGADADGDGRVTYEELAAFVRVANQAVRNERYRPEILAQPPRAGDGVLVALGDATEGRVRFGRGRAGRQVLEDGLGIRWADVHPSAKQDVTLALPASWGDGDGLYLRTPGGETEIALSRGADVLLPELVSRPSSVGRRGAVHEAFASLFTVAFDADALAAQADVARRAPEAPGADLRPPSRVVRVAAVATGAAGVAALITSGLLAFTSVGLPDDTGTLTGTQRQALNDDIDRRNGWMVGAYVAGTALVVAGAALYLYGRSSK